MLRLPRFNYLRPKTAREAAKMAADLGPSAMFVAGGTDLFPKLKRRQFEIDTLIGLDFLPREIRNGSAEHSIDAGVTLSAAAHNAHLNEHFTGYAQAAGLVSSPPLRNAGTIGGNLCVDTRSAYVKLRRRGSIDFPIAGAAVALQLDGEVVSDCRIVLSAVASYPLEATAAEVFLKGKRLEADVVREAVELAAKPAKPLDNADLSHFWRKRMVRVVVEQALARATTNGGASVVKLSGR